MFRMTKHLSKIQAFSITIWNPLRSITGVLNCYRMPLLKEGQKHRCRVVGYSMLLSAMRIGAVVGAAQETGSNMETERVKASYSLFLSKPDAVVAYLRRAAGETVNFGLNE